MSSYPRSGNTLLRSYLEKIMGLCTGSDTDLSHLLNKALLDAGLGGEGIVDKRVWLIKTHYPDRYGGTKFGAERAILLVRNPLDCVISFFNLLGSRSHDLSIAEDTFVRLSNTWRQFTHQEFVVWKDFYDWWLASKIPVHIVRYEDIMQKPEETLTSLMQFILNVETLSDTSVEQYIKIAC